MNTDFPEAALFNLLLKALEKNKEIHLNIVWGTLAFQVATIGWLITSKKARELIGSNRILLIVAVVAVLSLASVHYFMLYDTYQQSKIFTAEIESTEYFKNDLHENRLTFSYFQITIKRAIFRAFFTLAFFVLLIISFCYCKLGLPQRPPTPSVTELP